ncbi:MAG: kelch repeat-containing protein [Bacteroidota bacterium]
MKISPQWMLWAISLVLLGSCRDDDDTEPQVNADLTFESILTFEGTALNQATGFLASPEQNALYIAHRETNPNTGSSSERVIRYDLATGGANSSFFDVEDFITKRLHIIGDSLYVIGGSFINIYPLDLATRPLNVVHGLQITRFGSAVYQGDIYVWGGDIDEVNSDKIYVWDTATGLFEPIGQLPTSKTWAMGEIISGKLYIFGGRREFSDDIAENVVFIHDLNTNQTISSELPNPVARTFTSVHRSTIFLAGQTLDTNPSSEDLDIYFGVYNPVVQRFNRLETSLDDEGWNSINGMTIMNSKIYVLYGNANSFFDNAPMTIMVADIPS